jgi:hypothetical protein
MTYIVDLRTHVCCWCGALSSDTRVIECPCCGLDTCAECVRLSDEGTVCYHTTPRQRRVVTRQDWWA